MKAKLKNFSDIVVGRWKKNQNEVVKVALHSYKGDLFISLRTWFRDGEGQLKPGSNGLNLKVGHIRKLRKSLRKADEKIMELQAAASPSKRGRK